MTETKNNFEKWFKGPLSELYKNIDAGFIVVIVSLALLERYLREKSNNYENTYLNDQYYAEFINIFPAIGSIDNAKLFWEIYRHGLLHQSTLKITSKKTNNICTVGLNNDVSEILYSYDNNGDKFIVSPIKFSQKIICTIESDFPTFVAKGSPSHPLPEVFSDITLGIIGVSGTNKT